MQSTQVSPIGMLFRCLTCRAESASRTDGELLTAFLTCGEEAAFEILLQRHGPMVLGVCRRILRDDHDAEDAFQATFLVLLRRASELRARQVVGDWLHGVACRTALKARSAAAQRREKEAGAARPEPYHEPGAGDWRALLDHELRLLPEKYRIPVVLCDLEGKTRDEVARQVGWPAGTVAGRLARARSLLARRLAARGLSSSVGAAAPLLVAPAVRASLPAALVPATVRAATMLLAGDLGAEKVRASVVFLMKGVLNAMWWTQVKSGAVLILTLGLLGLAVSTWTCPTIWAARPSDGAEVPGQDALAARAQRDAVTPPATRPTASGATSPMNTSAPPNALDKLRRAKETLQRTLQTAKEDEAKEEPTKQAKTALKALQGKWALRTMEVRRDRVMLPNQYWTIKEDTLVFSWVFMRDVARAGRQEATIRLGAKAEGEKRAPDNAIDLLFVGDDAKRHCPGIYEVRGDSLRICYRLEGKGRPTRFTPNDDGTVIVMTFKRVNP